MIENVSLIVYDFDGVMTNNKVLISQDGTEMVQVNRADGLGVSEINKLGIKQIIISTEENPVVTSRARKLNIQCLQGIVDKKNTLIDYCNKNRIKLKNIIYVGNDINDYDVMQICGVTFCPSDSHKSIQDIASFVLKANGGDGVIRELFDYLIMGKVAKINNYIK
jgi:3-deoxy-D-manno-octulosonate 8-phosphate phosphatase (KDO 8-P phosphatase)